jgi:thiamine-phosphate pyrophosphorylase
MIPPRLILVTDPAFGDDPIVRCVERVGRELPRGTFCVQLRDKTRGQGSLRLFASRLRAATRATGSALLVNGSPDVARDVGADGVHLGSSGGSVAEARAIARAAWVAVAVHDDEAARRAIAEGADALVVSPVFGSRPPGVGTLAKLGRGLRALESARALAGAVPIYALGGVDIHNARACREAGAHGVAVMKGLLASASPARAARAIHDAVAPRW